MWDGVRAIVHRDVLAASRRRWTHQTRVVATIAMSAAFLGAIILVCLRRMPSLSSWEDWATAEAPAAVLREGASAGFTAMIVTAAALILGFNSREHAGGFAGEREKQTLDGLLGSRLTAMELVAGVLGSRLILGLTAISAGLPLVLLAVMMGGADPGRVLLGLLGVLSTYFFLGALAVAISIAAPTRVKAQTQTTLIAAAWLDIPFLFRLLGPRFFPGAYPWLKPANDLALASSPMAIVSHLVGLAPGPSLEAVVSRMAALEISAGLGLAFLAAMALRRVSRRISGGKVGRPKPARSGRPLRKRPPVHDDPMEWKERLAARSSSWQKLMGVIAYGAMFAVLGFVVSQLIWWAWEEVVVNGYGSAAVGDDRWVLNQQFLRPISCVLVFILMVVVAGTTAESLDLERKKGTWLILMSTPLTGDEILRAKARASLRRVAPFILALVLAWILGMVVGAIHPVGFLASLTAFAVGLRFATSLGNYSAVRAAGERPSAHLALLVIVAAMLVSPVPLSISGDPRWIPLTALVPPFGTLLGLMTWDEVHSAMGRGPFGGILVFGIPERPTGGGWLLLTATCIPILLMLATRWLNQQVGRLWETSVGRPTRPSPGRRPRRAAG